MKPLFALVLVYATSCASTVKPSPPVNAAPVGSHPLSGEREPVEANWKERMEQPYVYLEHRGDYREIGEVLRRVFSEATARGMQPAGPPFALFFDDPGRIPIDQLRARACLPLTERPARVGSLEYDILPRAMVVYARVAGAHPDVARCYPALFAYLGGLGWKQGGPVREVYLVDPASVTAADQLWTEIQIPWGRNE